MFNCYFLYLYLRNFLFQLRMKAVIFESIKEEKIHTPHVSFLANPVVIVIIIDVVIVDSVDVSDIDIIIAWIFV